MHNAKGFCLDNLIFIRFLQVAYCYYGWCEKCFNWGMTIRLGVRISMYEFVGGHKHPVYNSPLTPLSPLGGWQQNMPEMVTGSSSTDKASWGKTKGMFESKRYQVSSHSTRSISSRSLLLKLSCAHESPRWVLEWRLSFRRSGKGAVRVHV